MTQDVTRVHKDRILTLRSFLTSGQVSNLCAINDSDSSEFFVDSILDHKPWGYGHRYLVKFQGFPDSFNCWLSGKELDGDSALDLYRNSLPTTS